MTGEERMNQGMLHFWEYDTKRCFFWELASWWWGGKGGLVIRPTFNKLALLTLTLTLTLAIIIILHISGIAPRLHLEPRTRLLLFQAGKFASPAAEIKELNPWMVS